jgi:hypothetical protein
MLFLWKIKLKQQLQQRPARLEEWVWVEDEGAVEVEEEGEGREYINFERNKTYKVPHYYDTWDHLLFIGV